MLADYDIRIRWTSFERSNGIFVQEHVIGQHGFVEYGPMTSEVADAFVAERKSYFAGLAKSIVDRQTKKLLPIG